MRLIIAAAFAMAAIPAASAQYIKLNDLDGEARKKQCPPPSPQADEGINGGLNRDLIRRRGGPPPEPKPKPQESAAKPPELKASAAQRRATRPAQAARRGDITLKRGGC
ncbi:hypothetical protein [Sphingopyxis sp. MWB1]|uniref:hypothetical protein n=1 Tax=Sphingopyxis sp. MWB1 TaxID=1537715 RepID=UPI00051A7C8A|nr:hypothetical protein [Sphingopyxis sp. MWB1]